MIKAPIDVEKAKPAAVAHPVSIVVSSRPNFSTSKFATGLILVQTKPITKSKPIKPIPTVNPAFRAFSGLHRTSKPTIKIIIGIMM
ncbi:hypothetical protein SDC9_133547 [bioreactor metagenome]|uniref:Uncharacterized protein n=1 Tax=bioreactor metagenome TaxID=1076179 RepID=A0A645DBQ8_9ZZZZ